MKNLTSITLEKEQLRELIFRAHIAGSTASIVPICASQHADRVMKELEKGFHNVK